MRKKQHIVRKKIVKTLVSVAVLAVFIIPALLSTIWIVGTFRTSDPRKVTNIQPLQTRNVDLAPEPPRLFKEPIVSITFDDGWESIYTDGLPILQETGFRTTQYIISDTLDNYNYVSIAQIRSMQEAGHDIGSHTVSHADLTTLSDNELTYELGQSKQTLTRYFGTITDFTSPYGAYNTHTLQVISKYYRSQKNAEGDPDADELEAINVQTGFNMLNIKSYSVRKTTSLEDIKKLLKAAEANNGWLVLTYHQVETSEETFSVSPQVLRQQLQLISASNIRSTTVGQVLDTFTLNQRQGQ